MPKWIAIDSYRLKTSLQFRIPLKYLEENGISEDTYYSMELREEEFWLRKYYREKKEGIIIYVIDDDCTTPYDNLYNKNIKKILDPNSFQSFKEYTFNRYKKWEEIRAFVKENLRFFGIHMIDSREKHQWSIVDLTKEEVCSNCSRIVKNGELTNYIFNKENIKVCEYCLFRLDKQVKKDLSEVGYVYFLKEVNSGIVKIGKTKNLQNRITSLISMLPYKSELIHSILTPNYSNLESYFHNLYCKKKVKGEWFNLDLDDIHFIINFNEEIVK
ncbi:GIY-YIG nuclease family protein [Fictibacillus barbaricus]|uniref:Bacteriophage T5 Orf172 DNA-binding domain-containing protein n=1 Tax=Fictibacillus barbaricus TaxID=182136 RepID=A0ABU1U3Z3_9BACL|nr:GIY-YIG nuclease family protein [Fictibacillus barbaricus]MDR7074194.1 hypothetical protein [Fictibacillus barbaricus]